MPYRICSTGALGLSNTEVFPVRHKLMIVKSALYGWNKSLVTTVDRIVSQNCWMYIEGRLEEAVKALKKTISSPNHSTSNIEDAFSSNFLDYLLASPDYVPASPRKTCSSSSNSFSLVLIASPTLLLFHDDPYMKEFSLPKKQGHDQSSSSTSTLPKAFEKGESSPSASKALAMTQAAIRKLVVASVATALETQAATIANADNANRNPKPREAPIARKCSYKEFMS
nr:hypothetical protein [Tanacetum cinerariifolium]